MTIKEIFEQSFETDDNPILWMITHNRAICTVERFAGKKFGYWAYCLWKKRN